MTREKAIKALNYIKETGNGESPYKNDAQSIALDMAISALEDNTMEWLEDKDGSYECSKCHITRSWLISGVFNFCPNCGRKAVSK